MDEEKAEKKSVSFPQSALAFAERRARELHGGNLSRYIQTLVERDRAGASDSAVANALLDFCTRVRPDLAQQIADSSVSADDRTRFASAIVQALAAALAPQTIIPGRPLALVDGEYFSEAQKAALIGLHDIAAHLVLLSSGSESGHEAAAGILHSREIDSFRARWEAYFGIKDKSSGKAKPAVRVKPKKDIHSPSTESSTAKRA